ncbi:hypothetical protein RJ639_023273 [Escallonia herrerae]|uniref:SAM domain-containing protein n=1 Tax=Escallonia herrerae TaxID=1293975 RepID=A0AA89AE29_9ASTE|nr:hypothetical protein RJ639_023273 [Escallonia herrerae]
MYFEPGPKLDVLLKLCTEDDQHPIAAEFLHCKENGSDGDLICCPLCGVDISSLTHEMRQVHTNECLDEEETPDNVVLPDVDAGLQYPRQVLDASPARSPRQAFEVCPVREWLCSLGLARYAEVFVKEEVDLDTLQWLTEEDLLSIGVTALGPRKKIVHALSELRKGGTKSAEIQIDSSEVIADETDKLLANKLITDYLPGFVTDRKKGCNTSGGQNEVKKHCSDSSRKRVMGPCPWIREDAKGEDDDDALASKLQVLPLNQMISIAGVDVTCFDANHCQGSILILFKPPSGKTCPVHTLILDSTYCDPQYDFPKQDAVIQFVIEAIQAEAFNPKTLCLIGSYTIGKERLFVEVARVLCKKVFVTAAKLRLLECLGLPSKDMQWFTLNEQERQIHVVSMWTLASFKRLKHVSNQYAVEILSLFSLLHPDMHTLAFRKHELVPYSHPCRRTPWLGQLHLTHIISHSHDTNKLSFHTTIGQVILVSNLYRKGSIPPPLLSDTNSVLKSHDHRKWKGHDVSNWDSDQHIRRD